MFRAQANQFDEAVVKATDENLTSEDWSLILDVCDRVSASPSGPQSVIAACIKRLAHRNANVQIYTLELAHALSQNCGAALNRELASRSFTEALLRLANDRNTHQQVKTKVLERMVEWTEQFKGNPDLGIMEQAYNRLRQSNPGLGPPSKPIKSEIQDEDRRKEDEELQMALALSLREKGANDSGSKEEPVGTTQSDDQPATQAGTTAATVSRVRALYDFTPSEAGELAFRKGDVIAVLESVYKDWWKGSLRGQTGIFPLNYVEKLQDPSKAELEHDAEMEGEVFAQIRNVEKLLALLSVRGEGGMGGSRDQGNEEEITELYHQTLAIRPKLIELIGKYSQKKDDFTQLNEKFIKARRDYEALLESSMSQPPAGYGYPPHPRQPSQPYQAYGQPVQGYPPQPGTQAPYQSQGPPQGPPPIHQGPPHQDPQRFYSQPPPQGPPGSSAYQYPPHINGPAASPAPFHFMPGGVPPPDVRQLTPKPVPTASTPASETAYNQQPSHSANDRPQSVYTLNSGNPQELGTGGYESPIDVRHSYPPAQNFAPAQQQAQQHNAPPSQPPPQSYPPQSQLPSRPRQSSLESTTSSYPSNQQDGPYPTMNQQPAQQPLHQPPQQQYQHPPPPQSQPPAPPGPTSPPIGGPQQGYPSLNSAPAGGYQAYNPQGPQQQGPPGYGAGGAGGEGGADDASDFYR